MTQYVKASNESKNYFSKNQKILKKKKKKYSFFKPHLGHLCPLLSLIIISPFFRPRSLVMRHEGEFFGAKIETKKSLRNKIE